MDNLKRLNQMLSYMSSDFIETAFDLGIFETLHSAPLSSEEVAKKCGLDVEATSIFLKALVNRGLLELNANKFSNTSMSDSYLVSDSPHFLEGRLAGIQLWKPYWKHLDHLLKTGRSPAEKIYGKGQSTWQGIVADQKKIRQFLSSMDEESKMWAKIMAKALQWTEGEHLVELGAGSGRNAITILEENPSMTATLIDQPEIANHLDDYVDRSIVSEKIVVREGDFFNPDTLPANGSSYLLSSILHDWSDDEAAKILASLHTAMPGGSRLILSEFFKPEKESEVSHTNEADLYMLMYFNGRERRISEYHQLLGVAGFKNPVHFAPEVGKGLLVAER